jgi:hypothetical protein
MTIYHHHLVNINKFEFFKDIFKEDLCFSIILYIFSFYIVCLFFTNF